MSTRLRRIHRTPRTATALLLGAVLLAGCGGEDPTVSTTTSESSSPEMAPSESANAGAGDDDEMSADHNEADTEFAQKMLPHHRQAVEMSDVVLAKEGVDERVVALAERIKAAQEPEIEDLMGFLEAWGEEEAGEGMGDAMGGPTEGMMSGEDMGMLEGAQGAEAGRLFLEQMVMHHTSAVEMAQAEVDSGQNPQAIELAETIVAAQEAEITEMEDLLATV